MADYISKHDAYTTLKDLEAAYIYPPVKEAYATAARRIDQIKPADVQPVRCGEWQQDGATHKRCSNCKEFLVPNLKSSMFNYCPNCGARMDGDTDA